MSHHFVVCVDNRGYEASLERRKLYEVKSDERADALAMIRVVDESGEDYLYPVELFAPVSLPQSLEEKLASVA
jgi:hypothetical protein